MTTPTCPKCKAAISRDDVNVANDVAYCRLCNFAAQLSELVHGSDLMENVDFHRPPAGTWYSNDGRGMIAGATNRSIKTSLGLLGAALFWNGIVSVFVLFAIAGTLANMHITAPEWFPAPKMNGGPMSVGMTIFLWLFLTPFILIGLWLLSGFLSSLAGRTEVQVQNGKVVIFTGIGPLGYRRRVEASEVKDVWIWEQPEGSNRSSKTAIVIEMRTGKLIKFATMLTEERRKFVAAATRKALVR